MARSLTYIIFVGYLFTSVQAFAQSQKCFDFKPVSQFNDEKCSAVRAELQMKDCATGANQGEVSKVFANFECKRPVKRLKYWYKDQMLYGDLEKDGNSYKVVKTYTNPATPSNKTTKASTAKPPLVVGTTKAASLPIPVNLGAGPLDTKSIKADLARDNLKVTPTATPAKEEKVAVASTPAPAPEAAKPSPTPVAVLAPEEVKSAVDISKIKFSGLVDSYYSYNFNEPTSKPGQAAYGASPAKDQQNKLVAPNFYHDSPTLNLLELSWDQKAEPVGFRIDLGFGPISDFVAGTGSDESTRRVMQGYLSYQTPFGLQVDAGKFATHMGFESIEAARNWNYSYSKLFIYALPLWHNGVRATMPVGNNLSISGSVANGWNTFYENNYNKTYGGQIKIKPGMGLETTLNYIGGNETAGVGNSSDNRTVYEGIASYSGLKFLKVAVDYAVAKETMNGSPINQLTSTVFYARLKLGEKFAISPRYEMFSDDGVISTGTLSGYTLGSGQTITSGTLSLDYELGTGLIVRAEYGNDSSSLQAYTNKDGVTGSQSIATIAGLLSF